MRLDTIRETEARRAAEQREGATRAASVQVPGLAGMETPAAYQARVDRAAALARLEREITAKRVHVRQLQLCAQDIGLGAGREAYRLQHEAAAAELRELEERAAALSRDSPV